MFYEGALVFVYHDNFTSVVTFLKLNRAIQRVIAPYMHSLCNLNTDENKILYHFHLKVQKLIVAADFPSFYLIVLKWLKLPLTYRLHFNEVIMSREKSVLHVNRFEFKFTSIGGVVWLYCSPYEISNFICTAQINLLKRICKMSTLLPWKSL